MAVDGVLRSARGGIRDVLYVSAAIAWQGVSKADNRMLGEIIDHCCPN